MRISGHLNPAVTLGFLVTRRIEPMMAVVYIVAQLLGAIARRVRAQGAVPAQRRRGDTARRPVISRSTSRSVQAIALEAIATFFLVFVVFGTAVDPHAPKVGGFAIGLTVTADILAIGPLTGASMNPARSFGPAVASGIFEAQVVYWIGPILGGDRRGAALRHPVPATRTRARGSRRGQPQGLSACERIRCRARWRLAGRCCSSPSRRRSGR